MCMFSCEVIQCRHRDHVTIRVVDVLSGLETRHADEEEQISLAVAQSLHTMFAQKQPQGDCTHCCCYTKPVLQYGVAGLWVVYCTFRRLAQFCQVV